MRNFNHIFSNRVKILCIIIPKDCENWNFWKYENYITIQPIQTALLNQQHGITYWPVFAHRYHLSTDWRCWHSLVLHIYYERTIGGELRYHILSHFFKSQKLVCLFFGRGINKTKNLSYARMIMRIPRPECKTNGMRNV